MFLHCVTSVIDDERQERVELVRSCKSIATCRAFEHGDTFESTAIPVYVCVCMCVCECVRACVCVCVCVCV